MLETAVNRSWRWWEIIRNTNLRLLGVDWSAFEPLRFFWLWIIFSGLLDSLPLLCDLGVLLGWCSVILLWAGCLDVLLLKYHWQRRVFIAALHPNHIWKLSLSLCFIERVWFWSAQSFQTCILRIKNSASVYYTSFNPELLWCNGEELLKTHDQ